jgi:hypothetical protein
MRWHFAVEAAPPNDRDAWSVPDIPPERLEVIAGHCRQIERLGLWGLRMPFGLMYVPGRHINTENLSITLCDGVIGFSCATFVLHFFDTVGIRLLDVENWRSRAQDTEIQRRYVEQLRAQTDEIGPPKFGADYPTKTHVEAAESQIGCFRYRPEEVAAACLFDDLPVDIDKAEPAGKRVLQFIDEQSARADQQGGGFM